MSDVLIYCFIVGFPQWVHHDLPLLVLFSLRYRNLVFFSVGVSVIYCMECWTLGARNILYLGFHPHLSRCGNALKLLMC